MPSAPNMYLSEQPFERERDRWSGNVHSALDAGTRQALIDLRARIAGHAPEIAPDVVQWMEQLAGGKAAESYFLHPEAFPALLLPALLEKRIHGCCTPALQTQLIASTISGYYFIRIVDNAIDRSAADDLRMLPCTALFHAYFQRPYHELFSASHPFWRAFEQLWTQCAQATMLDGRLREVDAASFERISSKKTSAAKIPLVAVCHFHRHPELAEPWREFVDVFGCWHQMVNDAFDWHRDESLQNTTYVLSEAKRRRSDGESVAEWLHREGWEWAVARVRGWMHDLRERASALESPELQAYLDLRSSRFEVRAAQAQDALRVASLLAALCLSGAAQRAG
jgi:hypothetical protein